LSNLRNNKYNINGESIMEWTSIVLERGKCAWGRCYFCGWGKKVVEKSIEDVKKDFDTQISKKRGYSKLKIFSSGSFLDDNQFPKELREYIFCRLKELGFKEVIIESRVEFITKDKILELKKFADIKFTIAIGLEVADNDALKILNKGLTLKVLEEKIQLLKENNIGVRLYVLANPHPKLRDIELVNKTVEYALRFADSVVVINTYPHVNSQLWEDWIKGRWRPLSKEEFNKIVERWKDFPNIEFDFNNFAFIPKFPKEKRVKLKGVGHEFLVHPYYEVWQDFLQRIYEPPKGKEYVLFLPCAYVKPYTKSKTWRAILRGISGYPFFKKLHIIAISSPGVIPYEFINYYPFNNYDWPEWLETKEIKREYIDVTKKRIKKYIGAHYNHYKNIYFAYFKLDAESLIALRNAFEELRNEGFNIQLIECLSEDTYKKIREIDYKPLLAHPEAVNDLKKCLKDFFMRKNTNR